MVELVAGVVLVVEGVVVLVELGVVVLVEDCVVVVVLVVVDVVVGVEVVELVLLWQLCSASCPTVLAPWSRFCRKVVLIVDGRPLTDAVNADTARDAAAQCPSATAVETESS